MENSKWFQRMDLALAFGLCRAPKRFRTFFSSSIGIHEKKKEIRKKHEENSQRNGLGSLLANRKFVSSVLHTNAYNIQLFVWQVCLKYNENIYILYLFESRDEPMHNELIWIWPRIWKYNTLARSLYISFSICPKSQVPKYPYNKDFCG